MTNNFIMSLVLEDVEKRHEIHSFRALAVIEHKDELYVVGDVKKKLVVVSAKNDEEGTLFKDITDTELRDELFHKFEQSYPEIAALYAAK